MTQTTAERVIIELTPEQQDRIFRASGVAKAPIEISPRRLSALTLAALGAGMRSLPYSRSESTIRSMLGSASDDGSGAKPLILEVPLDTQQQELLFGVTGHRLNAILLAPDEWHVDYHESWSRENVRNRVGRSFVIVPADEQTELEDGKLVIRLPPADGTESGVFGTGKHNATRLALALLEDYVRAGDRVLDVGTGSGILAVAAAQLGARSVVALDIDPDAVEVARRTTALNGFEGVIEVGAGSLDDAVGEFDVLVMNIFPQVLTALAPYTAAKLRPDGRLIASGMVRGRAPGVIAAMTTGGLEFVEQRDRGSWSALLFRSIRQA